MDPRYESGIWKSTTLCTECGGEWDGEITVEYTDAELPICTDCHLRLTDTPCRSCEHDGPCHTCRLG